MLRGTDIARAAAVLKAGGLVAFPTETVYGLGADAARDDAVAKVFAVKRRPTTHPLIVHLAPGEALDGWAADIPVTARLLARTAWPGPLTLVLRRGPRVALAACGGASTVAIRVPAHPLAQQLLAAFGGGIAAPSANRFGAVSPTTADHVVADLGDDVDYVLDGGACAIGVESTIVDLSRGVAVLLRPGGLPREAIEPVVGRLADADADAPVAPGTLPQHYAPHARVIACEPDALARALAEVSASGAGRIAVLAPAAVLARHALPANARASAVPDDPAAIAQVLYARLRELDDAGVDVVIAALPPTAGLGEAVRDRLVRASGSKGSR
jgi:L-threonylcarbamoyladenylate synthase